MRLLHDDTSWRFRTFDALLVSQTDRNGNTVGITRDSQGRVTALSEPRGRQLTLSYIGTKPDPISLDNRFD